MDPRYHQSLSPRVAVGGGDTSMEAAIADLEVCHATLRHQMAKIQLVKERLREKWKQDNEDSDSPRSTVHPNRWSHPSASGSFSASQSQSEIVSAIARDLSAVSKDLPRLQLPTSSDSTALQLPVLSDSRALQLPALSDSTALQLPASSDSTAFQLPALPDSPALQLPALSDSTTLQLPALSGSQAHPPSHPDGFAGDAHSVLRRLPSQFYALESEDQAIYCFRGDGTILMWNPGSEKLFGYSAEEALGRNILELLCCQETCQAAAQIIARAQVGHCWTGNFPIRSKSGEVFDAMITDRPIFDAKGSVSMIVGVASDSRPFKEQIRALIGSCSSSMHVSTSISPISTASPGGAAAAAAAVAAAATFHTSGAAMLDGATTAASLGTAAPSIDDFLSPASPFGSIPSPTAAEDDAEELLFAAGFKPLQPIRISQSATGDTPCLVAPGASRPSTALLPAAPVPASSLPAATLARGHEVDMPVPLADLVAQGSGALDFQGGGEVGGESAAPFVFQGGEAAVPFDFQGEMETRGEGKTAPFDFRAEEAPQVEWQHPWQIPFASTVLSLAGKVAQSIGQVRKRLSPTSSTVSSQTQLLPVNVSEHLPELLPGHSPAGGTSLAEASFAEAPQRKLLQGGRSPKASRLSPEAERLSPAASRLSRHDSGSGSSCSSCSNASGAGNGAAAAPAAGARGSGGNASGSRVPDTSGADTRKAFRIPAARPRLEAEGMALGVSLIGAVAAAAAHSAISASTPETAASPLLTLAPPRPVHTPAAATAPSAPLAPAPVLALTSSSFLPSSSSLLPPSSCHRPSVAPAAHVSQFAPLQPETSTAAASDPWLSRGLNLGVAVASSAAGVVSGAGVGGDAGCGIMLPSGAPACVAEAAAASSQSLTSAVATAAAAAAVCSTHMGNPMLVDGTREHGQMGMQICEKGGMGGIGMGIAEHSGLGQGQGDWGMEVGVEENAGQGMHGMGVHGMGVERRVGNVRILERQEGDVSMGGQEQRERLEQWQGWGGGQGGVAGRELKLVREQGNRERQEREQFWEEGVARWEIRWEDIQLGQEVGHGACGTVYHGTWNGSDVAVKVFARHDISAAFMRDFKKEIRIMEKLRHPNILLFMGAVASLDHLAIVTEFLPRGSLFRLLHRRTAGLTKLRLLRMALDVARGVNYLHKCSPPVVHHDLKSANLLVDRNWTVKVGDFGLSKMKFATYLSARSGRGTPQWMAPEVLRNEPSNEKSDVYSFGVVLWEMATRQVPWEGMNPMQVVGAVGFLEQQLPLPNTIDPAMRQLVSDCWRSPCERPSFDEITTRLRSMVEEQERQVEGKRV
ncbi:hypothetical protein CLOM_g19385 [Closterium sp. NIES-68]|nr:hypothetical protein CLOM_g19385 [Closterium sp. NIES-68]